MREKALSRPYSHFAHENVNQIPIKFYPYERGNALLSVLLSEFNIYSYW